MNALAVIGGIAYVQIGYVVALGGIALYALSLVLRQRALARRLPPEELGPRPTVPVPPVGGAEPPAVSP